LQESQSAAVPTVVPSKSKMAAHGAPDSLAVDPDLARVVDAWATLPPAARASILELVGASIGRQAKP
jgi:hypothetical protein